MMFINSQRVYIIKKLDDFHLDIVEIRRPPANWPELSHRAHVNAIWITQQTNEFLTHCAKWNSLLISLHECELIALAQHQIDEVSVNSHNFFFRFSAPKIGSLEIVWKFNGRAGDCFGWQVMIVWNGSFVILTSCVHLSRWSRFFKQKIELFFSAKKQQRKNGKLKGFFLGQKKF